MSYNQRIEKKLNEICTITSSKRIYRKEYEKSGIPFYRSKEVIQKHNNEPIDMELFISKERYHEIKTQFGVPKKGDILLTSVGTLGIPYYIDNDEKFYFKDGNLTWFKDFSNEIHSKYLYYYLLSSVGKEKIDQITIGSTQKAITIQGLKSIKILMPSKNEQVLVTKILSSIDDKIKLNNKINNKLEELAQTLYKHWFVDFEFPNEEGLPYKSSGGKMVESDLGLIPEGWEIREQGDYFPVITGKKNANYATLDGKFKFFTCSQQVFQAPDYSFDGTAILVAGNGDFNVKYYSGKFEAYQRTYVLIPKNSNLAGLFYFMIKENLNKMTSCHRGSVIKFITKGDLENYKIITPDNEKLEKLSYYFTNIINTIEHNKSENEKLTKLRDLLLPKLMSGEIRVPIEEE